LDDRQRGFGFSNDADVEDLFAEGRALLREGERLFSSGRFNEAEQAMQRAQERLRQAGADVGWRAQSQRSWNIPQRPAEVVLGQKQDAMPKFAAIAGITALAALFAGPLIAMLLAFTITLGALVSAWAAMFAVAGVLLPFILGLGLFGFWGFGLLAMPALVASGVVVGGLGIGAAAVFGLRTLIPRQKQRIYPEAAAAASQQTVEVETEETRQKREYMAECDRLAQELKDFDTKLHSDDNRDVYRRKLQKEGLWKD
jgi:hypothetical protein